MLLVPQVLEARAGPHATEVKRPSHQRGGSLARRPHGPRTLGGVSRAVPCNRSKPAHAAGRTRKRRQRTASELRRDGQRRFCPAVSDRSRQASPGRSSSPRGGPRGRHNGVSEPSWKGGSRPQSSHVHVPLLPQNARGMMSMCRLRPTPPVGISFTATDI